MKYLLIAFVIFVALAPLSHFVPSKRQRHVARLREYAAVNGLFVEFRSLPGSNRERDAGSGTQGTIYYGKRLPASKRKGASSLSWLQNDGAWRPLQRGVAVPQALQQMPPQVLAASADEHSCGVYWQESGEVDTVECIRQNLEAWSSALRQ